MSSPVKLGPTLWYAISTGLLLAVIAFVMWGILGLGSSGAGPASAVVHDGNGPPPQRPPFTGAPRPAPIRPTPRLVRSAAEPLPRERDKGN